MRFEPPCGASILPTVHAVTSILEQPANDDRYGAADASDADAHDDADDRSTPTAR